MVLAPFFANDVETLTLHSQLVLFLFLKWSIREWECGFTMMEYRLRGCKKEDTFLHSILGPVVDVYDYDYHRYIIPITLMLGIISYYRGELIWRQMTAGV